MNASGLPSSSDEFCFPYILFMAGAALFSGVLNAGGRFIAAAAAPVILNVFFIAAMLAGRHYHWNMGLTLSWTTPITGAAQMGLVWIACVRMGLPIKLKWPRMTPELRRLLKIAFPAVMAGGVVQLNLLVGRQVGSFFDGAIAWLNYADRLYQLPLGIFGIAIGVVLLPDISRRLKANDVVGGRYAYNRATEFALMLTMPAAVALMVIPVPLISVLFKRGQFSDIDVVNTASVLAIYGAGLPAFVLQKVLQPLYFAREDTKTPFRYAWHSMIVNAAAAVLLAPFIGFLAAALGTTLAGWSMVAQLWWGKSDMGEAATFDDRLIHRVPRLALASLLMGGVLFALAHVLSAQLVTPGWRYLALAELVLSGILAYAAAAFITGAVRIVRHTLVFRALESPTYRCRTAASARPMPPGHTTKDKRNPAKKPATSAIHQLFPVENIPKRTRISISPPIISKARSRFAPDRSRSVQRMNENPPTSP